MCGDAFKHGAPGAWREVRHHVAGAYRGVERLPLTLGCQVKLGEVGNQPARAGMVGPSRLDQLRVGVDTNHHVASGGQFRANSSWAATGIQHA